MSVWPAIYNEKKAYNAACLNGGKWHKLVKGSQAAKYRMAYVRSQRGTGTKAAKRAAYIAKMHIPKGKVKKGSAAAKRKMAILRAMKGGGVRCI